MVYNLAAAQHLFQISQQYLFHISEKWYVSILWPPNGCSQAGILTHVVNIYGQPHYQSGY